MESLLLPDKAVAMCSQELTLAIALNECLPEKAFGVSVVSGCKIFIPLPADLLFINSLDTGR